MSLINKMLQDLESRKNPQAEAAQKKSVYEDLKPLSRASSSRAPSRRMMISLLSIVTVVGAGVYAWTQWGDGLVTSLFPGQAATQPPPVVARKAPPPKPIPVVPAPAPAPVVAVVQTTAAITPPAPTVAATDKAAETPQKAALAQDVPPVAVEQKKTEIKSAPAMPAKTLPAKSKTAAAESGYWTVSRGETLYGISAKSGIDLWDLSSWNRLGRDHVIQVGQRLRLTPPAKDALPAKAQIAAAPEKEKTAVVSTAPVVVQKSGAEATPTLAASAREIQAGSAVMDKKVKPLSSDEKAENEFRRAVDLLQKGRMADAEKHLKSAMHVSETHAPSRELLAGVMLQQGHWREAQQLLEQGIDKVPAHYPFAQLLARIYVEHGADQKALTVMEASRRAAAGNPDYVAFLAALYQRAGKHAEAVKTYTEAVSLNPQEGRWWLGMGISLEATQDWANAEKAYQRAISSGTLDGNLLKYARQRLVVVKNK